MKVRLRARTLLAAMVLVVPALNSFAQPAPSLKILVGFPAGGAPDAVARAFADQLRQASGVTAVVDNRAGASGKIAIDAVLAAPADGQTAAVVPSTILGLLPSIIKSARYDPVRDFIAVANLAEYGFGFAAGPASGATDIGAYRAWARANPRQSSYATPGTGTPQHFLGAQLQKALGVELAHVPYKGGALAINDVMGGQVPLLVSTEQLLVPHEGQGKLRMLLVTSRERNPRLPNVPTAREVGLAQLEATDWFGLFVKAGTPAARVEELRAAVAKVLASSGYREAMAKLGYGLPHRQGDLAQQVASDQAAWVERFKLSGFTATD